MTKHGTNRLIICRFYRILDRAVSSAVDQEAAGCTTLHKMRVVTNDRICLDYLRRPIPQHNFIDQLLPQESNLPMVSGQAPAKSV